MPSASLTSQAGGPGLVPTSRTIQTPGDASTKDATPSRVYSTDEPPNLQKLKDLRSARAGSTTFSTYPLASIIDNDIPVYDAAALAAQSVLTSANLTSQLQNELHHILLSGPGVLVLKNMYPDQTTIDAANAAFTSIIAAEAAAANGAKGDHFAAGGKNARIWNSFSKHARADPASFVRYYSNRWLALVSEAWLGPAYRVTAQLLAEGYMAYRLPQFVEYFDQSWVSLPLEKGDGVFFNPALFHAAGENVTQDVERCANLLQVSSAFGKTMESISTLPVVEACWKTLIAKFGKEGMSGEVQAAIKAIGEGYPFPTNLDRRPPQPGGMAPEDEQGLLRRFVVSKRDVVSVSDALRQMRIDSRAS
ncbi:hypothetical protein FH972_023554 [Carpinus fangiana]|uniref:Phytanoyl-CoA dioxygenase n=1 Tax=Carpinus fangiana TaxID=176857 RepID=A0A5N6KW05_9ROSI|nr:hypothetical protein FH972_023554 [Carpinus fangiana]